MGIKLIYSLIILAVIVLVTVGLFVISKKHKSKTGMGVSILLILLIGYIFMTNYIDQWTFSKKDVLSDLSNVNIELKDDFKIIKNDVSGMSERLQHTALIISDEDRETIIEKIKNSGNFKSYATSEEIQNDSTRNSSGSTGEILNFKYPEFYSIETYKKIDDYPTRLALKIKENNDTLWYQRIEL